MSPTLSVILCAHNPRQDYLDRTLQGLRAQNLNVEHWELLIVDNASREPLAAKMDLRWHPNARVVVEPKLGLTPARFCGIAATQGGLIVFVDDDNVLSPDYLEKAVEISTKWPQLGVWGGQVKPEYEVPPQPWMRPHLPLLALREFDSDKWSNLSLNYETSPCGAGMCVRRLVAAEYMTRASSDPIRSGLGRRGASLASCEDSDLAFTACDMGYGHGQFVDLRLTHLIPKGRLEEDYLLRLTEGIHYSLRMLAMIRGVKPLPDSLLEKFSRFVRRMRMSSRERRFFDAAFRGAKSARRFFEDVVKANSVANTGK